MVIQDHVEDITFAVSNIGKENVYLGLDWLKKHNPSVDWTKSRILMNNCPLSCQFISSLNDLDDDDEETVVEEEETPDKIEPLEQGDQFFYFNADSFLDDNHIAIHRCEHKQEINRTNYNYVLKYEPIAKT